MSSDYKYLNSHRAIWGRKEVLRRIYREQFYAPLLAVALAGQNTLEIGSGPGFLREIEPSIWRTDILHSPWNHCVVDAHHLPFASETFTSVIGLDVIHHLNKPVLVLREIARVLRPGGRLAVVEPWITPVSRLVYTYLHQEGCDLSAEPWREDAPQFARQKQAFDGNAAIPYLLIERGGKRIADTIPELKLTSVEQFCSLTYLMSLGFKPVSLLPVFAYSVFYRIEQTTRPLWARFAAMRALIIWEKAG